MIVTPEGHAVPQADRIVVTRKATDDAHDGLVAVTGAADTLRRTP